MTATEADPWAEPEPYWPEEAAHAPASWAPVDLTGILDGTWQPPTPNLLTRTDGVSLLYPGLTHSFHGESESGKSLVAQWLTAQLISQNLPVAYIDYESDPGSVVNRITMFKLATHDQIAQHLVYIQPETDPKANGAEARAFRELARQPFALIVLDGVTGALVASGMDSNGNDDVTRWAKKIPRYLADHTGAAVVMIDHVVKSREGRGRHASGAHAKLDTITGAAFTLEPKRAIGQGLRGIVSMKVGKDRPGQLRRHGGPVNWSERSQEVARFVLDSTGETPTATLQPPERGASDEFRPTQLMEDLSKELEGWDEPRSKRQIEQHVPRKSSALRLALERLITEGYVKATPGPRNALLHASIKPYRQADDPRSDQFTGQPVL